MRNWKERLSMPLDLARQILLVLQEAFAGFQRNDDFRHASSLAYYTALALLPALLVLTTILSFSLVSSQSALQRLGDFMTAMIPQYSEVILQEVNTVYRHMHGAGFITLLVLLWTMTPLVGSLRRILEAVFRVKPHRSVWTAKALDLLMVTLFLLGIASVAVSGVLLRLLEQQSQDVTLPHWMWTLGPLLSTIVLLLGVYRVFTPCTSWRYLLAGSLTTAIFWALMKPAFQLLLTVNPRFGFAFGSFKSIFIVILWIYYSQVVLLLGAEVVAALYRKDTVMIKRLMEGRRGLPLRGRTRFLRRVTQGEIFFQEGERGSEMYHVLAGSVSIRKGECEIAVIGPGTFFGEMTFLLGMDRSATAVAREDSECIVINQQSLDALMREYPDTIRDMLVEMAKRLRGTNPVVVDPVCGGWIPNGSQPGLARTKTGGCAPLPPSQ